MAASQLIFSLLNLFIGKIPLYILFLLVIFFSTEIIVMALAIRTFLSAFSIPGHKKQQSLKKYALLILAIFIPDTILNISQIFELVALPFYVFLKSLQILLLNLLPVLFMKGFIQKIYAIVRGQVSSDGLKRFSTPITTYIGKNKMAAIVKLKRGPAIDMRNSCLGV